MKRFLLALVFLAACQRSENHSDLQHPESSTQSSSTSTARTTSPPSDAVVSTAVTNPLHVMDTTLDAPNFQCAPKVLTRRDTLTLRAEVPHGGGLAVKNPNGDSFMLISPLPGDTGFQSLVDPVAFRDMLILRLRADLLVKPSVYGRDALEAVFDKPGDYVFTIADNLETEYDGEEDPNWHCTVRLAAAP